MLDISTVMWKELRELLFPEGRLKGGLRNIAVMVGVAGVMFPLNAGRSWFDSWLTVYTACFPVILCLSFTADSVAGERERHTLETLLASRLPDRAIVLGKIFAISAYAFGVVMLCQPVAALAVNVAFGRGDFLFYRFEILASIVVIATVFSLLVSAAGVIFSMTAPTARAAAQRMIAPFLLLFALPGLVPLIAPKLGPSWKASLESFTPDRLVAVVAVTGAVAAAAMIVLAVARFKRHRVVLV
ncbi:MAG: ABC transporter permease subunit [Vicinamibacterales bacterium]